MVDTDKEAQARVDELDRLARETQDILDASAKLMAELKVKLEDMRQLRAAHDALMEERRKSKK